MRYTYKLNTRLIDFNASLTFNFYIYGVQVDLVNV